MASWQLLILAIGAAVLAAVLLALWLRRGRPGGARRMTDVLAVQGPARCLAAVALLRRLAAAADQRAIDAASEELELPLLQALPDCPPPVKPELADALEACARATRNRAAAKRLMTLRNALLG